MNLIRAAIILVLACGALGQSAPQFEKVLVPITVTDAVGAYGAHWSSKVSFLSSVGQFRLLGINNVACATCSLPPAAIPPNITVTLPMFATAPGEPPGSILYIDTQAASDMHFALNVVGPTGFENPVPVVRERDLLAGTAIFPHVANRASVRNTLRVYNVDPEIRHGSFNIRVFDAATHDLLQERNVELFVKQKVALTGEGIPLNLRPEAIEIAINAPSAELEIEIRPLTSGIRYWAFIATTSNETQEVAVVLPN